ncbi:DMT family transporter [Fusobacterium sp.]|uniref:DMT family transporter n=1 Tax=Fusobacterium sp. TaxID=68766 RepID=UPI00290004A9|nr:DMT family transporter [Fusobacterium sp.]MDU1910697.1 DMT family transporter [Fusobacterium sp.]
MNDETKSSYFSRGTVVFTLAMIYCVLGGSAFPGIKLGYTLFNIKSGATAAIILFAGLRFTLAGIATIAVGSIIHKSLLFPAKGNFSKIAFLGFIRTTIFYSLMYLGLAGTNGIKASVINGTNLVFAMLASCFIFRQEKFTKIKCIAGLLCFSAIVLLNLDGDFTFSFAFRGEGLLLLSAVVFGLSDCITKMFSTNENAVTLSGWQFLIGGSFLLLIGFGLGGRLHIENIEAFFILFYLVFVSSVTFVTWGILLKYNPISKVVGYKAMEPIFGTLLSAIVLSEYHSLGLETIAALALVCTRITLLNCYNK